MRIACSLLPLLCLIIVLPPPFLHAAAPDHRQAGTYKESAFISGIGSGKITEGDYQPVLLMWHLGMDLKKSLPRLEKHRGSLSFFIETQFNPSHNPDANFEFGISPGFQYRYPFTEKLSGYLLVSVGPHYMSLVTRDQENGFIFSDAIGGGLYYFLNENFALNLGYRFRHMSNTGLTQPNGGINTNFITFGYAAFF
ncbi:MAG: acyloxyacyl hydrolase [Syntrophales bacterium]|nr:acyloxyacyl hydrolase [Syntrophales bacterium]